MRRSASILFVIATGCSAGAPDESGDSWQLLVDEHPDGLLLSVWGREADDVWVVGGRPGATSILHGDARRLEPVVNPGTETAWWVCGAGDSLVVVGEGGLVLVDRGSGFLPVDVGIDSTLYGCWGTSPDDFWIVGGEPDRLPPEPQLARVQDGQAAAPDLGETAAELVSPASGEPPTVFFKVWGTAERLFVVGDEGVVLTQDRSTDSWSLERLPDAPALFTVSGPSPDDVWAVGGRNRAVATHYDGASWSDASPPDAPGLFGVSATSTQTIACGDQGTILERIGDSWSAEVSPTADTLHAVAIVGDRTFAVGGNVLEPDPMAYRGTVVVR